ncbi:BREX-1 system adenine-specific DNA-methyltransferase PglX [Priestia megaterium]|uniref:BREX-1 system adenine-specific DNA-methyltransferase PglX n=1 Tax=Priestia megaterium TaxID=1404 RepID=UPI0036DE613B
MNKSAIKNFATSARVKLMGSVMQKAYELGITKREIKEPEVYQDGFRIGERLFSRNQKKQYDRLIAKIREKGYEQIIEEVAYTWFNRFIAIRFMEVNEYLPTGIRVLSSIEPEKVEPDAVGHVLDIADELELDLDLVYRLQDENNTEGVFKYILVKQCNKLGEIMPVMFEQIEDYTELLLPDNLLAEGSVVRDLVSMIEEEDWKEQVEIIGWLYQFYIFEEKDRVIKAKNKYKTNEIPFATQLFTPKWIVQYMVQNSLGRYWIESNPEDVELIKGWDFYLENPNKESDFEEKLAPYINKELKAEEIKCFDPAMGSGHILVYMFDVLYEIYKRGGYNEREIPRLIIEHNLFGLDIDERAYQLAYFSLIMKGVQYNRRFLRSIKRSGLSLNIAHIKESNQLTEEDILYIAGENAGPIYEKIKNFVDVFRNANIYGSLIHIKDFDREFIEEKLDFIKNDISTDLFESLSREKVLDILPRLINQAKIMKHTYDILVTNPPYLGSKYMNSDLANFIKENYSENRTDLFAAFMEYAMNKTRNNGQIGMLTPFVWMFTSSYENLRKSIVQHKNISSLIQLEYNSFPEATVPVCCFTLRNYDSLIKGEYIRLSDFKGIEIQPIKVLEAVENSKINYRYSNISRNFNKIPGLPIAYWASEETSSSFINYESLGECSKLCMGMRTGDNKRFLRLWHEINKENIGFNIRNAGEAIDSQKKWFPYNKGGKYRKWYGNNYFVVNWLNDGEEIKENTRKVYPQLGENLGWKITNESFYFKEGLTWSSLTSGNISMRYSKQGFIFDTKGSMLFSRKNDNKLLALLNSKVAMHFLKILAPTLDYNPGSLSKLPININSEDINKLSEENIAISINDWDSFETSWNFEQHPFLMHRETAKTIEESYHHWKKVTEEGFNRLKANEEELNRIFIGLYGLEDALTPEVEDKEVTIRKADQLYDVKSFISYAIGCMLGRYSLNQKGLVFAGGEFDENNYVTFKADKDNVIPITDDEYFEEDIVSRFAEFMKVTFSKETLEENFDFIAEVLGRKGNETSRQTIRRYFLKDFYKDHIQTYQKRPIYWLFDSGKQNGFKALIYMHRYDESTVAKVRTDYLHLLQRKYEAEMNRQDVVIDSDVSPREQTEAKKRKEKLQKQLLECREYDQVVSHVANQRISINLDDGVKINYMKFQDVEVPQGEGKKPLKANLLSPIKL